MKTFLLFLLLSIAVNFTKAADYFWVGGTGNWSDISHWATTSGGSIMFFTPPTATDNVFFDANSFTAAGQIITINTTAVCNNLDWTSVSHNPAFSCSSTFSLRIYGSVTFVPGMTLSINGSVYFEATTAGKTIASAGKAFDANVYFQGLGGGWTLSDQMQVNGILHFLNGTLNLNGKSLNCGTFNSDFTNTRTLNIANSTIQTNQWKLNGSNLTFSATGSVINAQNFNHTGIARTYHNIKTELIDGGGSDFNLVKSTGTLQATNINNADSVTSVASLDIAANNVNFIRAGYGANIRSGGYFKKVILDSTALISSISRVDYLYIAADADITGQINAGTVIMKGNGFLGKSNTFDTLILTATKIYTLGKNETQTIGRMLGVNGRCSGYISIQSSATGALATISKSSGNVIASYVMLRDIMAAGGAIFTANNSIDLGNNPGWIINAVSVTDLYWVGGTGNWTDTSHWSTSSGGPGGACVPNPKTNVHFDANSFNAPGKEVTMNAKTGSCRDIIWTGASNNPSFRINFGNKLKIFGSLSFIPSMSLNIIGDLSFEAVNTGKTITTCNIPILGNVHFDGTGGGWMLLDTLHVKSKIFYSQGNLNTNKKVVLCNDFSSTDSFTRNLNISNSTIIATKWNMNGNNCTINATNSMISEFLDFIHLGTPCTYHNLSSSILVVTIRGGGSKFNVINITKGTLNLYNDNTIDSVIVMGAFYLSNSNTINYLYVKGFAMLGSYNNPYNQLINKAIFDSIAYLYGDSKITYLSIDRFAYLKGKNTIVNALLYSNSDINGNNTFDTLSFFAGNTYTLQYNSTQTINKLFNINGRCSSYITLISSDIGNSAGISKSTGFVTGNYLIIRDINASGGAVFTANNSIDGGNNSGWNINAVAPNNLYWVGGSGNWSDSSHWAFTSGGPGSACTPGPFDNVFFDFRSFTATGQTVQLDVSNAYCNNMVWTGALYNPAFNVASGKAVYFYGSLTLIQAMDFKFDGFAYFHSKSAGKTITSAGHKFGADVHFDGQGGEWTLQDSFTSNATVYFMEGKLSTNSQKFSCSTFNSYISKPRILNISNSLLTVTIWGVIGQNFTLFARNSHITDLAGFTHIYDSSVYHNISTSRSLLNMKGGDSKFNVINVSKGSLLLENNNIIDSLIVEDAISLVNSNSINFLYAKGAAQLGSSAGSDRQHINKAVLDSSAIIYGDNIIRHLAVGKIGYIQGNDTFGNVYLYGDAIINGNILYDSLTFSAGKTYQLQDGKTQTIKYSLAISGNNCFPTSVRSRKVGSVSTFYKSSGKVSADFLELRDIRATGGASFFAGAHSSNLGNNPGWIFTTAPGFIYGFGKDTIMCYGDLLRTSNLNGVQTFIWQDSSTKPYYKVTKPGSYWVTAAFGQGCTYADTIVVLRVKPRPESGFVVNDSMQCISGNSFNFIDTSAIDSGTIASRKWMYGDGLSDTIQNPTHVYGKSDTFFMKLINESDLGCIDTVGTLLYVYDPPRAGFFINDSMQCLSGNSFEFTNATSPPQAAVMYIWDFGDGNRDTSFHAKHSYTKTDTFNVVLHALSGNGCDDSASVNVVVFPAGVASFSINDSMQCLANNKFTFSDNAPDDTKWHWDLGNGDTSVLDSFVYSYITNDTFFVKLKVLSASGCIDSASRMVVVHPSPKAGFSVNDTTQCLKGNLFSYVPAVVDNNIRFIYWDFGDTSTAITDTAAHSYDFAGTYSVKTVFVATTGCTDSMMKNITIFPSPRASFVIFDSSQCFERNDFGFTNTSTVATGKLINLWDFGDKTFSVLTHPHHQYLYVDTFSVVLKVITLDGCTDTFVKNTYLHVHPEPLADFTINDTMQCFKGNSFGFANSSTIKSGTFKQYWDFNDGTVSDSFNTQHSFATYDTFTTKLLVISDWGCKDSLMKKLYVFPEPKADFSINTNPQSLAGNNFVFTNLSNIPYGNLAHSWDYGDGATSNLLNGNHSYGKADTFDVQLRSVSDEGCADSISKKAIVIMTVVVDFVAKNFCLGDTVEFESFGNAYPDSFRNYIWDYGDGNTAIVWSDPVHSYTDTGTYSVTLIGITWLGYRDTVYKSITILPKPSVSISYNPDTIFYKGEKCTITANGMFDSIFWSTGEKTISITVNKGGIYSVRVVGSNGCDATDRIRLYELEMKPFEAMDVITPNEDGINDVWKIFNIEQYQPCRVGIYNRWGNELFSTDNYQNDWGGTWNGKKLPEGTYYYFVETRNSKIYKGAINIVK